MAGGAEQISEFERWGAMLTVMLGMMSTIFSSTMVNVAIPDIMGAYGIGQDRAHWMSTGFFAAMTVSMLLNAWLMQNLGARNTYVMAIALFCAAGIIGDTSSTYEFSVLARVMQGCCAGLLQPLAMNVIIPIFPPEKRGRAIATLSMGIVLGPALGPTVGGVIVDTIGWRFTFVAALPLSIAGALMALRFLPGRDPAMLARPLNWASLSLVILVVSSFLVGLSSGPRLGWTSFDVLGLFTIAAFGVVLFFAVELHARHPLIQMRLFRIPEFASSAVVGVIFGAGMFGSIYLMPLFVQTILGYTATKSGLLQLVAGSVMIIVFPISGRLAERMPTGYPILVGMALFAVSSWVLAGATLDSGFWFLSFMTLIGRVGLGLTMPSLNAGALGAVGPDLLPYAAGTLNFVRMLGASVGINVLAITVEFRHQFHLSYFRDAQSPDNSSTSQYLQEAVRLLAEQGVVAAERVPYALRMLARSIDLRAGEASFQDGFMLLALGFCIGMFGSLLLMRRRTGAAR